jgi:hypothetical protein
LDDWSEAYEIRLKSEDGEVDAIALFIDLYPRSKNRQTQQRILIQVKFRKNRELIL